MRMLDAARRLGISADTLRRFLAAERQLGLLKRTPGGHYRLTDEDIKTIDRLMTQRGMNARPEQRMRQGRDRYLSMRRKRWYEP